MATYKSQKNLKESTGEAMDFMAKYLAKTVAAMSSLRHNNQHRFYQSHLVTILKNKELLNAKLST
jgi:uncharacterized protein YfdQ (DUF2303 family)